MPRTPPSSFSSSSSSSSSSSPSSADAPSRPRLSLNRTDDGKPAKATKAAKVSAAPVSKTPVSKRPASKTLVPTAPASKAPVSKAPVPAPSASKVPASKTKAPSLAPEQGTLPSKAVKPPKKGALSQTPPAETSASKAPVRRASTHDGVPVDDSIPAALAARVGASVAQVAAAIGLLDAGDTVPFIARYRKEVTGGLDDVQLRALAAGLKTLRALEERRAAVRRALEAQGHWTPALAAALRSADTRAAIDAIHAPFKTKKTGKAARARDMGFQPLADRLRVAMASPVGGAAGAGVGRGQPALDPVALASTFLAEMAGPPRPKAGKGKKTALPKEGAGKPALPKEGGGKTVLVGAADGVSPRLGLGLGFGLGVDEALAAVRDILVEEVASDPTLFADLRAATARRGALMARVPRGGDAEAAKPFADVLSKPQRLDALPSHRLLGVLRAAKAGVLSVEVVPEDVPAAQARVRAALGVQALPRSPSPLQAWLAESADGAWKERVRGGVSTAVLAELREKAEQDAVAVFARNLRDLLLAAPAGPRTILGIDPGIRTGIKVAVIDPTGKILATDTFYPYAPKLDVAGTQRGLSLLIRRHGVEMVAIGSGTGGRETLALVRQTLAALSRASGPVSASASSSSFSFSSSSSALSNKGGPTGQKGRLALPGAPPVPQAFLVSEAGASVYSASEAASRELPHLDVSLRGAVSIARRVQDPLAELVKIDPAALGVGQYQHDIDPVLLREALADVVQDAVAAVGVDANVASAALLAHVPGVGPALAQAIVEHREAHGPFSTRQALKKVPRMGPKAFEQCAGFLRVRGGKEPLDATGIHPESYGLARSILDKIGLPLAQVLGKPDAWKGVKPEAFVQPGGPGLGTVRAICEELARPGRDPRPSFQVAALDDAVQTMEDLRVGMRLQGTVTNVATFGAFVDIGVHQDGLVHVSQMADRRVEDPHSVARIGQTVDVVVLSVDLDKKRIALSMKPEALRAASQG